VCSSDLEEGCRKTYVGLPVTASALIFPTVLMLQYILPDDVTMLYFVMMAITGIAFISPFQVVKPGLRGILIMIGIGAAEFVLLAIFWWLRTPH
jgi:CDP-diacylglycerol--serine O-phosphatidyltransferase